MRFLPLACLLLLSACFAPKPCTRAMCVTKLDGTMELSGWSGTVRATSSTPQPPIVSNTTVTMVNGAAEFTIGKTRLSSAEGSVFKFSVSTRSIPSIEVFSGAVAVTTSTGAAVSITPGATYALPKP